MKKNIVTIITVLAYIMLVAGVASLIKGLHELYSTYTHHPDPAPFLAIGAICVISFPFAMGFRYIVEAAVKYIDGKTDGKQ